MATVAEQVQQLYIGLLGYAADSEGAAYWEEQIEAEIDTLATLNASLVSTDAYSEGLGSLSREDAVTELYNRMFGRDPEDAGLEYWTTGEGSSVAISDLAITFLDAALDDDAVTLENKAEAAIAYTAAAGDSYSETEAAAFLADVDSTDSSLDDVLEAIEEAYPTVEEEGETTVLTEGRDNITGTDNADEFLAYVGQNSDGALSNALATGDIIDGGAGTDTLEATLIKDGTVDDGTAFDVTPILESVENIRIEALEDVTLDADHIEEEEHYASDKSDADLVITNIDIESTEVTQDVTFEMKDTEQFSDLEAYFNEEDLVAEPDETSGSASVTIQVADGAQAVGTTTPLANMTFDMSFVQNGTTYSFEDIESTDGTYAGLVTAIETALSEDGLTNYEVELDGEFTTFETDNADFDLNYTGYYITITDTDGNEFEDITFAPEQKAGSEVAILLAQSEVNAESTTTSFVVEADVIVDNVGRGSNGGEIIIGSTSSSDSSTGVNTINVIVRDSSVISDISSTNDALENITITNDEGYEGDFVLANADFEDEDADTTDSDNYFGNVDQENLLKEGLDTITVTDFTGDVVLGRDNDIVDLGTLSASSGVTGDVTYNATLNDDAYVATTGSGNDTLDITLDDNRIEANTDSDTSISISTGAGNDTITVDETDDAVEITTATIDSGAGDDVIYGNDVTVDVEAGAGDDVVYVENTGTNALLVVATTAMYTTGTAATDTTASTDGEIHFLDGREVTVSISTSGLAADELNTTFESEAIEITASTGTTLTTIDDLNEAILEAVNENEVLNKIVEAYVDENNNVAFKYLVDGVQNIAGIEITVSDQETATVTSSMEADYEELLNDSTASAQTAYDAVDALGEEVFVSADTLYEGSTITLTAGTAGNEVTVTIGDVEVTYTTAATAAADGIALTAALVEAGFYAADDGAGVVSVVTEDEILFSDDAAGGTASTAVIVNDTLLDAADVGALGTDSVDTDNANTVNAGSGDDVIVLGSEDTATDTVVWTGYNQGDDTIVHFVSGTDELDFTSYLTGTVESNNSGSTSEESEVALTNTVDASLDFTANSINLVDFGDLSGVSATQTLETLTTAELEAALEAADATTTLSATASTVGDLYQDDGVSILIIQDADNAGGAVTGDDTDLGTYSVYEVTYEDATYVAGDANLDFSVTLIGTFDLGDDVLATGDLTL
ncbi:beta strand repeat-containing protein [Marinomonas sp. 2405UD66-6]|uniref:beta strand repeat-containing protein n=1 Tax=Marinomonas sp. 2405UD66-6 TaxID=3391834 RepID=UPI0039C9E04C